MSMFPVPDALAGFYLICFGVGFLFVFVSLFLGLSHDTLHLPGMSHLDVGHGQMGDAGQAHLGGLDHAGAALEGHLSEARIGENGVASERATGSGTAGHHAGGISPINLSTIMAFLTWFGGAGYILRVYTGMLGLVSLVAACLAGLAGGAVIFFFLARILYPGQRFLDPADYRIEGTVAQVTVSIRPEVVGEIVYCKGGSRRSEGARSLDGKAIEHGTEVVIVRYEKGIAYVEPWNSFVKKG
jgi:hypothetical protein